MTRRPQRGPQRPLLDPFCEEARFPQRRVLIQSGRDSRRDARAGLRVDGAKQLFCIRLGMERFADVHPLLLLLVPFRH